MRKERKGLIIDYQRTFNTEAGQNVLKDLRKKAPLMDDGLNTQNGVDVNSLLVNQGRNDVILYIYKMLKKDPYEEREKLAKGE